jgi:hypothetical protein
VTDEHLANVALAFAASSIAMNVGEHVDVLRRQKPTHSGTGTSAEFRVAESVVSKSLGEYLAGEISRLRRGEKPVVDSVGVIWGGGKVCAGVVQAPFKETQDGTFRPRILAFGDPSPQPGGPGPEKIITIKADLLRMLADFLGPVEAA